VSKGNWPTSDGKFKGRKYECAICGLTGRRKDMAYQRGALVHRSTCYDLPGHKPKP